MARQHLVSHEESDRKDHWLLKLHFDSGPSSIKEAQKMANVLSPLGLFCFLDYRDFAADSREAHTIGKLSDEGIENGVVIVQTYRDDFVWVVARFPSEQKLQEALRLMQKLFG